jgi:ATP-dependent RNA helicase RhlE
MGFLPDLRRIVAATPAERQTLMFSATMPEEIRRLAAQWLRDPAQVQVAPASSTIDAIEQAVYFVATEHKAKMLTHYLQTTAWERTLVFVRTKHGADKVVKTLQRSGIKAAAIHGNKSQSARSKTLEHFKSQQPPVLVATDVASRGLDIRGVSHVINYELPEAPEVYVHRIGRTGRAGANGVAVALCSRDERSRLRSIERLTRKAVPVVEAPQEYACPGGHEPQPAVGSGQGGARRRPQKASRRPAPAQGGGARRTAGAQGGSGGPAGSRPPRRKRKPSVSRL